MPSTLGSSEPQALPEGQFRVVDGAVGYSTLELLAKGEWKGLYTWRSAEKAWSEGVDGRGGM